MSKTISSVSFNGILLFYFIVMCSLFLFENAYSRRHWNKDYVKATYDTESNVVKMQIEFYDYDFGPALEDVYLQVCDFDYAPDSLTYKHFMAIETNDQHSATWTWTLMRRKTPGTQLQFDGCYMPASGTTWSDADKIVRVEVNNVGSKAWLTINWFLDSTYKDVKTIRLNGIWHVNGIYSNDKIDNVDIDVKPIYPHSKSTNPSLAKTDEQRTVPKNNVLKVTTDVDLIVINGTEIGEKIKVYTTSGVLVKSFVANKDVVKFILPANQIYIIYVGQAHYKVAF